MNKNGIGVVGNGFVGGAIVRAFNENYEVKFYDKDPNKGRDSFEDTISNRFVFVCLPTPMIDAEGGKSNMSIIENFFQEVDKIDPLAKNDPEGTIYIIKSTVPVGTTENLCKRYRTTRIMHSPEFLRAKTADIDFITASRHIIGGSARVHCDYGPASFVYGNAVADLYSERFPGANIITMDCTESETVKYVCNTFFATKIMFFNEIKLLVDKLGLNWESITEGVMSDGRIGLSFNNVPGHDGEPGFGGFCFPKDINSLISVMETQGIDPVVIKSVWEQNKNIRKKWDWIDSKSSVLEESKSHDS